jgi:mono/diheme cytochrome c family protein
MIRMGWRLHMKFIINSALFLLVSFLLLQRESLAGQKPQTETQKAATQGMKLDTGQEIFEAACVGCHGPGGRGHARTNI